ncbi:hypothetical protein A6R68_17138 [Neotoma lepida]|uniref:Uncharacterized protein n=1 Tax=Neotoma lepida TaxID=56216 RepID=A0A1A6HEP4_NEOLE|nr:hypothetical protein A6R68_17138 [Neotoma lepida]
MKRMRKKRKMKKMMMNKQDSRSGDEKRDYEEEVRPLNVSEGLLHSHHEPGGQAVSGPGAHRSVSPLPIRLLLTAAVRARGHQLHEDQDGAVSLPRSLEKKNTTTPILLALPLPRVFTKP